MAWKRPLLNQSLTKGSSLHTDPIIVKGSSFQTDQGLILGSNPKPVPSLIKCSSLKAGLSLILGSRVKTVLSLILGSILKPVYGCNVKPVPILVPGASIMPDSSLKTVPSSKPGKGHISRYRAGKSPSPFFTSGRHVTGNIHHISRMGEHRSVRFPWRQPQTDNHKQY